MPDSFDFSDMNRRKDSGAPSAPSPQSPAQHETSGHHSSSVTIYQTTGPDAYTGPILSSGSTGTPRLNPRSCVTCRRRKVRCDKQMPCSNCRRALIPCVFPAPGRAPRQARPKDPNVASKTSSQREVELVKRLKKLEGIVEELSGQIELEADGKSLSAGGSPEVTQAVSQGTPVAQNHVPVNRGLFTASSASPRDNDSTSDRSFEASRRREAQAQFGRLVLDDSKKTSRYVSSGFWSKLNDELNAIREERQRLTDEELEDSDDEDSSDTALDTTPFYDHHSFVFGFRSADVNLQSCHPSPSHADFLWSVYKESVEPLIKIIHVPSVEVMLRDARRGSEKLTPTNEALMFAIYFSAVTALEPEEVQAHLVASRDELVAQYRFALEQSLAKANFLTTSELTILQALTIFLVVVRRHDDSRFCWSLTGLLIRLAQGMGLHRDGTHFGLPPFETEIRRRVWWGILILDVRSAEELGTDMTISERGFDTQMPLNLNDSDINPADTEFPPAREGRSDCAVPLVRYEICSLTRRLLSASSAMDSVCPKVDNASIAEKERMLVEVYQRVEHKFLQHVIDETDPLYWFAAMISRIIMAKMCLVIYQPMLFPGSDHNLSEEIRQRIYVAAIEINEYNHKLQVDPRCKPYRWLFLTYTIWHAIAYTLIETCRRPWTALVERGWEALNGYDRDPVEIAKKADHAAVFLPVRKLFVRARRHRESELARLRANPDEARRLDFAERMNPAQARFGPVPGAENSMEQVREKWRLLVRPEGFTTTPFSTWRQSHGASHGKDATSTQLVPTIQQAGPSQMEPSPMPPVQAGFSDATMQYMNEFMSQPTFNMTELWKVNHFHLDLAGSGNNDIAPSASIAPDGSGNQADDATDTLRQQALLFQTQPAKDVNARPYIWSDPFTSVNSRLDETSSEEMDLIGDDFNWQDWSQSIRGLEMESTRQRNGS